MLDSHSTSDAPSDFLFNANLGFGLPTSGRVRKRNTNKIKSAAMTNSHGGPIKGSLTNKECQVRRSDSEVHIRLLQKTFPRCVNILDHCGIQNNDTKKLANFGTCLNSKSVVFKLISKLELFYRRYPETVTLNLGQTLSSGHGSVSFSSDAECSQFVKSFFPQCGAHLQSCHEVVK